jgi:hypothetical protein
MTKNPNHATLSCTKNTAHQSQSWITIYNAAIMPHPNKKQRLTGDDASLAEATAVDGGQMMAASVVI